ncbi:MAG: ABC transporter ATP-binding protein [Candidatus Thermoplasmatota archaeon]
MGRNVIKVKDLTKKYNGTVAVEGISFKVREGEIFSLVGPNGAGKTTTVEILECLRKPTSGDATVLGHNILEEEAKIKEKIGVMPQNFNTLERLTARENIQLMADIYGSKNIDEILKKVGVDEFEDKKFADLSGGMKTKVGIGMTLISNSDLLFLDEPTTGLDPHARRETWNLIKELKKMGKTVFLTTHYMEEVENLSDRAAILIDGEIEVIDTIENLIEDHGGGMKVKVFDNGEAIEIIEESADEVIKGGKKSLTTGIFDDKKEARQVLIKLFQLDCEVEVEEAGMDEVFIRLTGGKIDEGGELV